MKRKDEAERFRKEEQLSSVYVDVHEGKYSLGISPCLYKLL